MLYKKTCLFGATNIVRNSDKTNYLYRSCRIAFDGAGRGILVAILIGML